jgi:2-methylcitrate dehydratase PrpD
MSIASKLLKKSTETPKLGPTEAENIASFALGLEFKAIPEDVIKLAKEHLLDVIGIALASSSFEYAPVILKGAQELGNGDDATAIGSGIRLPATSAALVNGVLAHGLDFDDTHIGGIYHASAPAMASALASGEANNSTGKDVLTAFIIGLEVGCRLGVVGSGKFHERSFHPTSLCGTFAAAAVAGRLSNTEHTGLTWALGLCGSMAAGILEVGHSWLKRLHPGWAAHSGLTSVALGRAGFKGPSTVLEGPHGFYAAHIGEPPKDENLPSLGLGHKWETLEIALKPYPCCHFIHSFVDAALELYGQFNIDDVERIECPLTEMLHGMVAEPRERCVSPPTIYSALFSVHFSVAAALAKGRVDLSTFYDEPLDDPEIVRIAKLIHCIPDPDSDFPKRFPGEVIITMKDGSILKSRKLSSFGTPDFPMPQQAIYSKFISNATRVIDEEIAINIIDVVMNLESEESLDYLMELCNIK